MSEAPAPLHSVEAVREELRRLGYLDSGLDRFVLRGAGGGSRLRASVRAALRVGLLGGALASCTLLLLAAFADRGLLRDPRDWALLALYLVVLLGGLVGLGALLAGLVAAWWARRGGRAPAPRLPRDLGLCVGLAALVYLTLWWRSHAAGVSIVGHLGAFSVGLALCAALGRSASLAAVAVLSAGGALPHLPQASLSRRHMLPLLLGAGLTLGAGAVLRARLEARGLEAPDFAVVPTGLRVRVVGLDGFEARMAEQLLERGLMPRLAALRARAAWARLRSEPEQVPAIVWTTIATGRGPEAHGIRAAGVRRLPGMRAPVPQAENRLAGSLLAAADLLRVTRAQPPTSVLRSAKTFWNVAGEKGLRVGVVNWWATWPADALHGYVVSERALFKLEAAGAPEREVHPPEAWDVLRALVPPPAADALGRARRIDLFALAAARALRVAGACDLEALYLPGLDIVSVQELGGVAAADLASLDRRLDAVRAYYAQVDAWIGEAVAEIGPRDVLVLVADPGRLARGGAEAPEGLLMMTGGPLQPRALGRVSSRDVAPTVLHLVGLPVSRELDGQVLSAALEPSFRAAYPVRQVDGYGRRRAAAPAESAFDTQMIEELRSLGYIQ